MENRTSEEQLPENNFKIAKPVRGGLQIGNVVLIVLGIFVVVIGIAAGMLYGGKMENEYVKVVANIIPLPAAVVEMKLVTMKNVWKELNLVLKTCEQVGGQNCQVTVEDKKSVENNLIDEKALDVIAARQKVTLDNARVEEQYKKIMEQNGGETEFLKILQDKFGWNVEDFKKKIYYDLLKKEIEDQVIEKVRAKHILVATAQGANEEEINKAKAKAQEALDKIKAGGNFDEIAKEYSADPGTKDKGGDLGFFARGMMVKPFEDTAFKLEPGQLSELVKTDYGWHIIKVEEKKGSVKSSFKDWLEEQKKEMRIWYLIKY